MKSGIQAETLRTKMTDSQFTEECIALIDPYLKGTASTCSYCDHLSPLILQEGIHTYITMAIGQIVEGYLQVCSQQHRTAATGLHQHEIPEMEKMKRIIRESYERIYKTRGIAFEHGKAGSCLWMDDQIGHKFDLCYHTHIHFVPVEIDIRDGIKKILPREIIIHDFNELKSFRTEELGNDSYLYFEDSREIGYAYPVNDEEIPRQFLRKLVATAIGLPERANWVEYPGIEYFEIIKNKLGPVIRETYNNTLTY